MFEVLLVLTAAPLLGSMVAAYTRYRDPLHPIMITGPLMLYGYVVAPLQLLIGGRLAEFFPDPWQLEFVQGFYALGVWAFCLGMMSATSRQAPLRAGSVLGGRFTNPAAAERAKLWWLALVLGSVSLAAYAFGIMRAGGLVAAYSVVKGGASAGSGYVGDAQMLAYPAIALLALSRQRLRLRAPDVALALLFALPNLLQGTLGGRRGPLFLVLTALFLAWWLAAGRRPSMRVVLGAMAAVLIAVVLMWSQRRNLFLGSERDFDPESVAAHLLQRDAGVEHFYIYGAGLMLHVRYHQSFQWGWRYFVTYLVRPIPRQIWPTKYEDMDQAWEDMGGSTAGRSEEDWVESVGWIPVAGSGSGVLSDVFSEFSWGGAVVALLLGRLLGWLWRRRTDEGGLWGVLFLEACILSIYLPTQSLAAFLQRFLFMSIPTALAWRLVFGLSRPRAGETGKVLPPAGGGA